MCNHSTDQRFKATLARICICTESIYYQVPLKFLTRPAWLIQTRRTTITGMHNLSIIQRNFQLKCLVAALAVNRSTVIIQSIFWETRYAILTSSNGRVSLKQLSQTSLTARSAASSLGHAGFATTDSIARRRTQALGDEANQTILK
jgi:hypothetical protein